MSYIEGADERFSSGKNLFTFSNLWKVAIAGALVQGYRIYTDGDDEKRQMATELGAQAELLRPQLPKKIDDNTTLVNVIANGETFEMFYTVQPELNPNMLISIRSRMQNFNRAAICNNPATASIVTHGTAITSHYSDKSGNKFDTVVSDCRR